MLWAGTALLIVGTGILGASLTAAVEAGNDQITAKLGQSAGDAGWPLMTATVTQIVAAAALLAFGITLSWIFGREFTDRTVYGLFALPVSRNEQTAAKFIIHFGWAVAVATAPTLWALHPDQVTGLQLALTPAFAIGFAALTARAWNRLQLDH